MDWVIAEIFIIVSEKLDTCFYPRILFKKVWPSSNVKHPCLPHMAFFCFWFFLAIWKATTGFTLVVAERPYSCGVL